MSSIGKHCKMGAEVILGEYVKIHPHVTIGNNVYIESSCVLENNCVIEDNAMIPKGTIIGAFKLAGTIKMSIGVITIYYNEYNATINMSFIQQEYSRSELFYLLNKLKSKSKLKLLKKEFEVMKRYNINILKKSNGALINDDNILVRSMGKWSNILIKKEES